MQRFIIGLDLGGTNLKTGLFDWRYRLINKQTINTKDFIHKESLIKAMADSVNRIINGSNLNHSDILAVGLGVPGPVDCQKGTVHFFPNIPGFQRVPLQRILARRIRLAVFMDNDVNLMALAESRIGAARGFRNSVCVTLGTGVGGGIIINGKIFRGSKDAAGEVGHIPVNEFGPVCNCGSRGCLESYIGSQRILSRVVRAFGRRLNLEQLSNLARERNKKAMNIWQDVGNKLGIALSGVVNLLNPDCLVIGGGLAGAGRILFSSLRKTIKKRAMEVQAKHVKVIKARLGKNAGLYGAAILAKEKGRA
jgi:glucokinase